MQLTGQFETQKRQMAPYYHVSLAEDCAQDLDESLKDLEAKKITEDI